MNMEASEHIDERSGRLLCDAEHPYTKERDYQNPNKLWAHSDIKEVGDQEGGWPGGDFQRYECNVCGISWKSELPQ